MARTTKKNAHVSSDKARRALIARFAAMHPRVRAGCDVAGECVRLARTKMPGLNRAIVGGSGPGGWPLGAVGLVHGPSGSGKTTLLARLMGSVLALDGVVFYLDAEHALNIAWVERLDVDFSLVSYSGRVSVDARAGAKIPDMSYEDAHRQVDDSIGTYRGAVDAGDMTGPLLVVVDSLAKLVPKGVTNRIAREKGDLARASLGMEQARWNTTWVAELGPKIGDYDISVVFIQHESEDTSGGPAWGGGKKTKIKGGQGIIYDAAVIAETSFAGRVHDLSKSSGEGEKDNRPVAGKKHRIRIEKTKVGPHPFGEASSAEFFVSTGSGACPIGWDRPRELVNEALRRGVVENEKGWAWGLELTLGVSFTFEKRRYTMKSLYDPEKGAPIIAALEEALR